MRGEYIFELCVVCILSFIIFMNWWDQRKQGKRSSHPLSDMSRLTESGPRGPRRGMTPLRGAGVVRRGRFSVPPVPGQAAAAFPTHRETLGASSTRACETRLDASWLGPQGLPN